MPHMKNAYIKIHVILLNVSLLNVCQIREAISLAIPRTVRVALEELEPKPET